MERPVFKQDDILFSHMVHRNTSLERKYFWIVEQDDTSFMLCEDTSFEGIYEIYEKNPFIILLETWLCNKKKKRLKPMVNALLRTTASAKAWLIMIETIKDTETASLQ